MNEQMGYFYTLWVVLNPVEGSILFYLKNWKRSGIFRKSPKTGIFSMQLVFFTVDRKSSQTKTFSRKVFFMFSLEHCSLKCIIKTFFFETMIPITQRIYPGTSHITPHLLLGGDGLGINSSYHCTINSCSLYQ